MSPLEMEKMDEKTLKEIEMETGVTRSKVKDDLNIIRNWVNQQPHLPTLEDDEETNSWLYNYLFYCKNRIEKVKQNLEAYFTCKSLMPEFYANRNPDEEGIKSSIKYLYLITLPKLTPHGYRVHLFAHAVPDPGVYEPKDFMRRALMLCDWKMKSDLTAGDIIIFDMKYSSLAHWGRYSLVTLSRFVGTFTKAYPLRIKSIHFIEAPSFINHIVNIPFITQKLKKRIRVHTSGNIAELLEDVPSECLPRELGGTLDATLRQLNENTHENILSMKDWFARNENVKSDESKRLTQLQDNNLFGSDGTFRTLLLD